MDNLGPITTATSKAEGRLIVGANSPKRKILRGLVKKSKDGRGGPGDPGSTTNPSGYSSLIPGSPSSMMSLNSPNGLSSPTDPAPFIRNTSKSHRSALQAAMGKMPMGIKRRSLSAKVLSKFSPISKSFKSSPKPLRNIL